MVGRKKFGESMGIFDRFKKPAAVEPLVSAGPAVPGSRVRAEKRELTRGRLVEALVKLERRTDEPARVKAAALRRELRALELEAEVAALRAGDVVVEPGPASLSARGN